MAKLADTNGTKHHIYWPRSQYKSLGGIAKRFCQIFFVMLRWSEHMQVHREGQPPPMPDSEYMKQQVRLYEELRKAGDKNALRELRHQEWSKVSSLYYGD